MANAESAAPLEELLRGLHVPRPVRRAALAAGLAALGLGLAWLAWRGVSALAGRRPSFARKASDLGESALNARLAAAAEKLDSDPENLAALVEAGALHCLKGPDQYRTAIGELETARRLGAVDPRIFYFLGVMYQEEGLLPFAIDDYRRFVRNFPEDREARLLLGKLLYQTGRYEDAAVQYQSLGLPRDPVVEENLGLSLLALKRYDEAAKSFGALVKLPAYEARAHFYLGQAAFEQNRFSDARAELSKAAAAPASALEGVEPTTLWTLVASVDEKLEDFPAAKEHWDQVLKLDPKSAKAKASLHRIAPRLRILKAAADKAARAAKAAADKAAKAAKAAAKSKAAKKK